MHTLWQWLQQHWQSDIGITIRIGLTVLLVAIAYFFASFILSRLHKSFVTLGRKWAASLLNALRTPLSTLIWVVGLSYAAQLANLTLKNPMLAQAVEPMRLIGIIGALFWFLLRFVNRIEAAYLALAESSEHKLDKTTIRAIARLGKIVVIVTATLVILQTIGIPITGLLAFGGVGAAGIAFAAQDILGNLFGGLMVYMNRPFSVGDWISSPDKDIEGTVEDIGWLLTRIRTFSRQPLYAPNSLFTKNIIVNPGRMYNRRIKTIVGVRYCDSRNVRDISKGIETMLLAHPEIDTKQVCFVTLVDFAASSLDILVYCFTKTTNWVDFQRIQEDVFLKIMDVVHAHDADMAFPTRTIETIEPLQLAGVTNAKS